MSIISKFLMQIDSIADVNNLTDEQKAELAKIFGDNKLDTDAQVTDTNVTDSDTGVTITTQENEGAKKATPTPQEKTNNDSTTDEDNFQGGIIASGYSAGDESDFPGNINELWDNATTTSRADSEPSTQPVLEKPAQSVIIQPIFGLVTISTADVDKIAAMSRNEKNALKIKINQLDLHKIFGFDRQNKGFVCPNCGNGSGHSGDGVVSKIGYDKYGNWYYWHKCFKCEFKGKLTDILDKITNKDFNQTLAIGAKLLKKAESSTFDVSTLPPADNDLTAEQKAEMEKMIRADIQNAPNLLEHLPADDLRGLSVDTLRFFRAGYLPQWIHPKNRVKGQNITPTRRIIIPTSENSYTAIMTNTERNLQEGDNWRRYKAMAANGRQIFNVEAICSGEPLFVVESETDAMSIWQVKCGKVKVVAVGGTSNKKKLLSYLNEKFNVEERINFRIIILLDNDDAGRKAAADFVHTLTAAGYPACAKFFSDTTEKIDANNILIDEGDTALKTRVEEIITSAQVELADVRKEISQRDTPADETPNELKLAQGLDFVSCEDFFNGQFQDEQELFEKYSDRKTGFSALDEVQIFAPGLYALGGLPSIGKTTFAWQIADFCAANGELVYFLSYEMSRFELYSKTIAREVYVESDGKIICPAVNVRRKLYGDNEEVRKKISSFAKQPRVEVIKVNQVSSKEILNALKLLSDKAGSRKPIFCIDYLQLIAAGTKEVRTTIDDFVRNLKIFCEETNSTVICLSSFNRDNYTTPVSFESFKETGGIEYSAEVVWGLQYRCIQNFNSKTTVAEKRLALQQARKDTPRLMQLVCLKNRFGSLYELDFDYYSAVDYFCCDVF